MSRPGRPVTGAYAPTGAAIASGFAMILANEAGGTPSGFRVGAVRVASGTPVPRAAVTLSPLSRATAAAGQERPLCEQQDPDLFFPLETRTKEGKQQVAQAKAVCARCPFDRFEACREEAIDQGDRHAIRGGMTPTERLRYAGRRGRRVA